MSRAREIAVFGVPDARIGGLWDELTGVVLDYALSTPPSDKWLMCYGQALEVGNPATAGLRAKLLADGSPYGTDGAGNPLVPDARGRAVAGKDDMGGAAAGRLTAGGAGINGSQLGAAGGNQTHTLTTAQMPAHNHGVNDPGHLHGALSSNPGTDTFMARDPQNGTYNITGGGSANGWAQGGVEIVSAVTGISTQNNGAGGAHPITQPTLVLNKIIKT